MEEKKSKLNDDVIFLKFKYDKDMRTLTCPDNDAVLVMKNGCCYKINLDSNIIYVFIYGNKSFIDIYIEKENVIVIRRQIKISKNSINQSFELAINCSYINMENLNFMDSSVDDSFMKYLVYMYSYLERKISKDNNKLNTYYELYEIIYNKREKIKEIFYYKKLTNYLCALTTFALNGDMESANNICNNKLSKNEIIKI